MTEITDNTLNLVREFEGFEPQAAPDCAGVPTIGYGHTSDAGGFEFDPETVIGEAQGEEILRDDLARVADAMRPFVPSEIQGDQFGALVSFVFNEGLHAMLGSTFFHRIKDGGAESDIREAWYRWCKFRNPETGELETAPGLLRRRVAEADLFFGQTRISTAAHPA